MTKARDLANASTALSAVSATELAFVDGVTSAIQTQLDARATLTGTQTLTNKTLTSPVLTTPTISTVNAKGDLLAGTADNTVDRLAIGSDGESLVADSAATTGLRYSATPSASNPILNSAYQVAQRGTSFTIASSTATYTLDRWQAYRTATGMTVTQQSTSDTTNLPFIQKCVRLARDSANTSTVAIQYIQTIESVNSIPYAGKAITLSFYARAGANYSPTSSALLVYLQTGTGTDQNYINGFTGATNIVNGSTATLTTTWQRFTFTATVGATATQLAVALNMNPTGTAGANDYCEVTGWQIDVGSVALPFRTYAATIQGELAACQRYYFQDAKAVLNTQQAVASTNVYTVYYYPAPMRATPTVTQTGAAIEASNTSATSYTVDPTPATPNKSGLYVAGGASTGTVYLYRPIQFSAEL
jgi:hypothetical protein